MLRSLSPLLTTTLLLGVVISTLAQSVCETNRLNAVKSRSQKVRGVNLGSWLILEAGISGAPWSENGLKTDACFGTYGLQKCLGTKAKTVFEKHWSTWVTESDFVELSKHGINLVRIPVGWWHIYDPDGGASAAKLKQTVNQTDYITGGLAYLDKAFDWGAKHGISVLIGLHSAPGSQNGNEHSSPLKKGEEDWPKYPANQAQTVDSVGLYAQRYGSKPAFFGIGLLNEPERIDHAILEDYYKKAYARIREHSTNGWVILSTTNNPMESGTEAHWTGFMNPPNYTNVAMEVHYYSCFGGGGDSTDATKQLNYIKNDRKSQIADYAKKNPKPMFIGEWSSCTHDNHPAEFTQAEVDVYNEAGLGWTFWCWAKGEPGNMWSMKTAFDSKWLKDFFVC